MPESGVWINDYPGMSTELMDKIASDDQATFIGVWNSVQRQAFNKFKTDVAKVLREAANARMDQVIFQTQKPFVQQWQQIQTTGPDAKLKGCLASLAGGKYLGLRVKSILVYNAETTVVENVPIKIYQSQNASIVFETEFDLQPGMNRIPVNQVFTSDFDKVEFVLLVDTSTFSTLNGPFMDYTWNWFSDDCASRWSAWFPRGATSYPVEAPLNYDLGNDWKQISNQTGIYWDAEFVCSLDSFICSQRFNLVDAYARLLSSELLRTKLASQRVNYFTQSNREITATNQTAFVAEYEIALSEWAQQLNLKGESLCFNCDDSAVIKTKNRLP